MNHYDLIASNVIMFYSILTGMLNLRLGYQLLSAATVCCNIKLSGLSNQ